MRTIFILAGAIGSIACNTSAQAARPAALSAQCRALQAGYRDDIDMLSQYMAVNAVGGDSASALAESNASS